MKTLFFIISAIGLVYLLVSSVYSGRFWLSPEHTHSGKNTHSQVSAQDSEKEHSLLLQKLETLSLNQRAIKLQLTEMAASQSQLSKELDGLNEPAITTTSSIADAHTQQNIKQEAMQVGLTIPSSHQQQTKNYPNLGHEVIAKPVNQSQQQKRLQQQAALRDLAQKRQLAAISALHGGPSD